jgi:hypothetical protein
MNPYANLQFQNPGNAFLTAFDQGRQRRIEGETQNALAKYAANPDDPQAMESLTRYNPQLAIQLQERKQQQALKGLEAHREKIVMGAKIVRQLQPKDDAGWQQVLQMAQQVGIDLADVPRNFDPQYVQGLVSVADALAPQREAQDPGIIREFQIATERGLVPPGTSYQQYLAMRNPGMMSPVVIPENATVEMPGQQGGPQPGAIEDGYRFKGGNPADPNSWEPVNGGPTPQASGTFPR